MLALESEKKITGGGSPEEEEEIEEVKPCISKRIVNGVEVAESDEGLDLGVTEIGTALVGMGVSEAEEEIDGVKGSKPMYLIPEVELSKPCG